MSQLWQFALGEELVVARQDIQGLFLLNSTARFVWEELSRGAETAEIVPNFVARYGVPESLARRDVDATLASWSQCLLSSASGNGRRHGTCPSVPDPFGSGSSFVEINCVLNGRGFRVLLEPGDLVEEIAPRLAQAAV